MINNPVCKTEYMDKPQKGYSEYWFANTEARENISPVPGDRCIMGNLDVYFCWDMGVWTKLGEDSGQYETKYIVTIPTPVNCTVTVKKGEETISSGDELTYGDTITITGIATTGYTDLSLTVNGEAITSGSEYTVKKNLVIKGTAKGKKLTVITDKCSVSVKKNGQEVTPGEDKIGIGESLTITATANSGYTMSTLTVNGETHTSGQSITVSGDVVIEAVATETPTPSGYTWNGTDSTPKDIGADDEHAVDLMHWVADDNSYTANDYIGATVIRKLGDTEETITISAEDIDSEIEGEYIEIYVSHNNESLFGVMKGYSGEGIADGLYLCKTKASGKYTSSLTLAQ